MSLWFVDPVSVVLLVLVVVGVVLGLCHVNKCVSLGFQ